MIQKTDFVKSKYDSYGTTQWRKYTKLTDKDKKTIESLKDCIGQEVDFFYRGKYIPMKIMAVITKPNETYNYPLLDEKGQLQVNGLNELIQLSYGSYPYQIRLDYTDDKPREWEGLWTIAVEKIKKKRRIEDYFNCTACNSIGSIKVIHSFTKENEKVDIKKCSTCKHQYYIKNLSTLQNSSRLGKLTISN